MAQQVQRAFVALLGATVLFHCATAPEKTTPQPAASLVGWYEALRDNKPEKAFAHLDTTAKKGLSLDRFKRLYYKHQKLFVAEALRWLKIAKRNNPREEAWVKVGNVQVRLIKTDSGWRITAPVSR